jgi:O-antigen ligase
LSPCHLVLLLVTIALGAALAMSWSRGAWLGFGAAIVVMAVALPRRARWGLLLVAILAVGGLGLYATGRVPPSVVARLTGFGQYVQFEDVRGVGINDANYAVIERLAHWQAALEMFRHDLWTGVGLGCYEPAYADFALINWPIALGHAHNYYLTVAAETGLVGLVAYLLLWGAVFWQTWRATRRARGFLRGVAIGLLGAWTHLSVHHFLDNLYVNNVHLHVGVLLGLLAFVVNKSANQQIGKSANRRVSESASQPTDQSTNRPVDQPTNRPSDQS